MESKANKNENMQTEVFPLTQFIDCFRFSLRCYSWIVHFYRFWLKVENVFFCHWKILYNIFCDIRCTSFPTKSYSFFWIRRMCLIVKWTSSMVWIYLFHLKWQFYLLFNKFTIRCIIKEKKCFSELFFEKPRILLNYAKYYQKFIFQDVFANI